MPAIGRTFKVASASPYLALLQVIDTFLRDAGFQVPSPPPAAETDIIEARVAHYDPAGPFDDAPRFIIKASPADTAIIMAPWHGARAEPHDYAVFGLPPDLVSIQISLGAQIHIAANGLDGWAWMSSNELNWTGITRLKRYPSDLTEGVAARFGRVADIYFFLAHAVLATGLPSSVSQCMRIMSSPLVGIDGDASKLTNLIAPFFISNVGPEIGFQPHLMGEAEDILKTSATGDFMREILPGFGLVKGMYFNALLRRPAAFDILPDI